MTEEVVEALRVRFGYWGEHPAYRYEEWQREVLFKDTRKGYWEWVASKIEEGT